MNRSLHIIIASALCLLVPQPASFADGVRKPERSDFRQVAGSGELFGLPYTVVQGDTIFYDCLPEAVVRGRFKKKKGTQWRQYYKLVYNFNKVYPYALVGRGMMAQVDSTCLAYGLEKGQRHGYIRSVERELLDLFEKDLRQMTISQGYVLLRLVDRECGLSPYEIIETYEGGFAADFWQVVARIFSHNLKIKYDPDGEDARIEELVQIWDSGSWDSFYFNIFWEYPKKTVFKTTRLKDWTPVK